MDQMMVQLRFIYECSAAIVIATDWPLHNVGHNDSVVGDSWTFPDDQMFSVHCRWVTFLTFCNILRVYAFNEITYQQVVYDKISLKSGSRLYSWSGPSFVNARPLALTCGSRIPHGETVLYLMLLSWTRDIFFYKSTCSTTLPVSQSVVKQ